MYPWGIHYVKNHQDSSPLTKTSSVLLDSLDDALENPGVCPLSRRIDICLSPLHTGNLSPKMVMEEMVVMMRKMRMKRIKRMERMKKKVKTVKK
jgi:hypothetical protein